MRGDFADRCRLETVEFPSLQGNPLGSPVKRALHVYLPPGYFEQTHRRYPVLYYLHGYGSGPGLPTVPSRRARRAAYPLTLRLLLPRVIRRLPSLNRLEALITRGEVEPFILVQPDASLHLPNLYGARAITGEAVVKGSLYTDSPFTGRYASCVFGDLVEHVDRSYRTVAEKKGRALLGGSMGGYGALLGGILHPERFAAVAALSPSICCLQMLEITLVVPLMVRLLGREKGRRRGAEEQQDILDTCDLVYSDDRRLLPTLRRDEEGRIVDKDPVAWERWAASDAAALTRNTPGAFSEVKLALSCHEQDEFGFAAPCRRFSDELHRLGIEHCLEIYDDSLAARLSPHTLGIAWHIEGALRWCVQQLGSRSWAEAAGRLNSGP